MTIMTIWPREVWESDTDWTFPSMSDDDLVARYRELARDLSTDSTCATCAITRRAMVRIQEALVTRRGYIATLPGDPAYRP